MNIWIIQKRGYQGNLNACLGVARHMGCSPFIIFNDQIEEAGGAQKFLSLIRDQPAPDIMIAAFQFSTDHLLTLKRLLPNKPFVINLRDPGKSHNDFDLMAIPRHDPLPYGYNENSPNTIRTIGIAHNVTIESLRSSALSLQYLPGAIRIAFLLGGDSITHPHERGGGVLLESEAIKIAQEINKICQESDAGLYITNSCRTSSECWRATLENITFNNTIYFDYRSEALNPYNAMLALADVIVVTADSMSMCTEACSTGKPVYIAGMDLKNLRSDHLRLASLLIQKGYALPLEEFDIEWRPTYIPLDPAKTITQRAKQIMAARSRDIDVKIPIKVDNRM